MSIADGQALLSSNRVEIKQYDRTGKSSVGLLASQGGLISQRAFLDSKFERESVELQEAFLSAPLVEHGWERALHTFARLTRSSRAQLVGLGEGTALFNLLTDSSPDYEREFLQIEAWRPEVNWRVAVTGDPLQVLSEPDYAIARARNRSDAYEEHVRKWGALYGCQTALVQQRDQLIGLATIRDEQDGKTSARDRALFLAGARHALAAVRMQRAIADQGRLLLLGAMEAIDAAVFLLDGGHRVVGMSAKAEALLRLDRSPLYLANARLLAKHRESDLRLQLSLGAIRSGARSQRLWLGVAGKTGSVCEIFLLPAQAREISFEPRTLVVIRGASDIPALESATLRQALGFTAAEAEIAVALANGAVREEVAKHRGTSAQTLNTQIKSVLHKSDVRREAELVALVNRLLR